VFSETGEPQSSRVVGQGAIATFGGGKVTYTNAVTGKSVTYPGGGVVRTVSTAANGDQTILLAGSGTEFVFTVAAGLPGIAQFYGTERMVVTPDSFVVPGSFSYTGQVIDICAALT
jgi:hypothetical protein